MTAPDLQDALTAERARYAPAHVPPFEALVARRRTQDRRKRAAAGGVLTLVVAAGLVMAPPLLDRQDAVSNRVAGGSEAARPDEQRLRNAFSGSPTETVFFATVTPMKAGAYVLGDRPRQQAEGVLGETADRTVSVSWTVLTPALTEADVLALAGTTTGSRGTEQGQPVASTADQNGAVRSVAHRFGDGSFLTIWAWSTDGGVMTLTCGRGATTTNDQVRAWESAMRDLLTS